MAKNFKSIGAASAGTSIPPVSAGFYSQDHAAKTQLAITKPPPPRAYQGLKTGPETSIEYESLSASQIEQSKSLLRTLSPFIIQVEPPLVFGSVGGFPSGKSGVNSVTSYGTAQGNTGYASARNSISQSNISSIGYTAGSPDGFITSNSKASGKKGFSGEAANSGKLGAPAIADVYAAVDVAMQLSAIVNTPPLVLLINPTSLQIDRTKLQQYQDRTRYGYVFQAWGEEQPKISITARCGAFISGGRGVHVASRRDSVAWQNLMNAFHFYKNNGYIYDTVGHSNAHHFVGALSIQYDQWIYYGHMESFAFTLSETNQLGGVEFTMDFTVSRMVDTAPQPFTVKPMKSPIPSLSDPRYMGLQNQSKNAAGNFSIGENGLTTQGRQVGVGEAMLTLLPENGLQVVDPNYTTPSATAIGKTDGIATNPVESKGFQPFTDSVPTPGQHQVNLTNPAFAEPFTRGY